MSRLHLNPHQTTDYRRTMSWCLRPGRPQGEWQ